MSVITRSPETQRSFAVSDAADPEYTREIGQELPIEKIRQNLLRIDTQPQTSDMIMTKSTKSLIQENGDHFSRNTVGMSNSSSSSSFDINDVNWNWKEKGEKALINVRDRLQTNLRRIFPHRKSRKAIKHTAEHGKGYRTATWLHSKKEKASRLRKRIRSSARSAFKLRSLKTPKLFRISMPNLKSAHSKSTGKIPKVVETLAKLDENAARKVPEETSRFVSVDTEYRALLAMFRDAEDLLTDLKMDVDVLQEVAESKGKDDKRELAKVQRIVHDLSLVVQSITRKVVSLEEAKEAHFESISNIIDDHKEEVEEFLDEYFHFRDMIFLEMENKIIAMLRRFDQQHAALYDAGSDLENMQTQKTLTDQLLDVIMGIVQITQGFVNHIVFLWLFHPAYRLKTFSWSVVLISLVAILYGNDLIDLNGQLLTHFAYFAWDVVYNTIAEILRVLYHNFLLPTLAIPRGLVYSFLGFLEYFLPTGTFRAH